VGVRLHLAPVRGASDPLQLIEDRGGEKPNEISDVLYWMLSAADTQALESRPLGMRCRCSRGLGYAHYHDGMILVYRDKRPLRVPLGVEAGFSLVYESAHSVIESNRLRPAGFDAFATRAGEYGYLRRTIVCHRPAGCGAEYPWAPISLLTAWLTAVSTGQVEFRLGRPPQAQPADVRPASVPRTVRRT
jgi:hypothetical protein